MAHIPKMSDFVAQPTPESLGTVLREIARSGTSSKEMASLQTMLVRRPGLLTTEMVKELLDDKRRNDPEKHSWTCLVGICDVFVEKIVRDILSKSPTCHEDVFWALETGWADAARRVACIALAEATDGPLLAIDNLNNCSSLYTLTCWLRVSSTNDDPRPVHFLTIGSGAPDVCVHAFINKGTLSVGCGTNFLILKAEFRPDEWHHVTITHQRGRLIASTMTVTLNDSVEKGPLDWPPGDPFSIVVGKGGGSRLEINALALFNSALTPASVNDLRQFGPRSAHLFCSTSAPGRGVGQRDPILRETPVATIDVYHATPDIAGNIVLGAAHEIVLASPMPGAVKRLGGLSFLEVTLRQCMTSQLLARGVSLLAKFLDDGELALEVKSNGLLWLTILLREKMSMVDDKVVRSVFSLLRGAAKKQLMDDVVVGMLSWHAPTVSLLVIRALHAFSREDSALALELNVPKIVLDAMRYDNSEEDYVAHSMNVLTIVRNGGVREVAAVAEFLISTIVWPHKEVDGLSGGRSRGSSFSRRTPGSRGRSRAGSGSELTYRASIRNRVLDLLLGFADAPSTLIESFSGSDLTWLLALTGSTVHISSIVLCVHLVTAIYRQNLTFRTAFRSQKMSGALATSLAVHHGHFELHGIVIAALFGRGWPLKAAPTIEALQGLATPVISDAAVVLDWLSIEMSLVEAGVGDHFVVLANAIRGPSSPRSESPPMYPMIGIILKFLEWMVDTNPFFRDVLLNSDLESALLRLPHDAAQPLGNIKLRQTPTSLDVLSASAQLEPSIGSFVSAMTILEVSEGSDSRTENALSHHAPGDPMFRDLVAFLSSCLVWRVRLPMRTSAGELLGDVCDSVFLLEIFILEVLSRLARVKDEIRLGKSSEQTAKTIIMLVDIALAANIPSLALLLSSLVPLFEMDVSASGKGFFRRSTKQATPIRRSAMRVILNLLRRPESGESALHSLLLHDELVASCDLDLQIPLAFELLHRILEAPSVLAIQTWTAVMQHWHSPVDPVLKDVIKLVDLAGQSADASLTTWLDQSRVTLQALSDQWQRERDSFVSSDKKQEAESLSSFVERSQKRVKQLRKNAEKQAQEGQLANARFDDAAKVIQATESKRRRQQQTATADRTSGVARMTEWGTVDLAERFGAIPRPFWLLDSLETSNRMRRRLVRNLQPRTYAAFYALDGDKNVSVVEDLLERSREIAASTRRRKPELSVVVDSAASLEPQFASTHSSDTDEDAVPHELQHMIESGDTVIASYNVQRGNGFDFVAGVLVLGEQRIYLIDHFAIVDHELVLNREGKGHNVLSWAYTDVNEVCKRRYLLREVALEFFAQAISCGLVVLDSVAERDTAYSLFVARLESGPLIGIFAASGVAASLNLSGGLKNLTKNATQLWQSGEMSNFDYLVHLNTQAGRTHGDLTQYPVFPWIVADYRNIRLDLRDPATFRDLSQPMGAIGPKRAAAFRERYAAWDADDVPPFHYGTHYSSAGITLHFLMRLEPFTGQFVQLQGGRFDTADRMFHSMFDAWSSASEGSMTDVKELVPELFYLPDMFLNQNGFNFGLRHDGERVDSVVLPPWAHGSAQEFVRLHRIALESEVVSQQLHLWIDLVFGHKQQGPAAAAAQNVFYHLTYEGAVDIDAIEDPILRSSTVAQISNFGQTPRQLFKKPHPQRALRTPIVNIHTHPERLQASVAPTLVGSPGAVTCMREIGDSVQSLGEKSAFLHSIPDAHLAWGLADGSLVEINTESRKVTQHFAAMHDSIVSAAFLTQHALYTGGNDCIVRVWKLQAVARANGRTLLSRERKSAFLSPVCRLAGHCAAISVLVANEGLALLISGDHDGTIITWDMMQKTRLRSLLGLPHETVVAIVISDSGHIIIGATASMICVWDLNGAILVQERLGDETSSITALAYASLHEWMESSAIISGHTDGSVQIWSTCYEVADGEFKRHLESRWKKRVAKVAVTSILVSATLARFYTGDAGGTTWVWSLADDATAGPPNHSCIVCHRQFLASELPFKCVKCDGFHCGSCTQSASTTGRGRLCLLCV